jgi:alkanesulfonate monooxygenase SsuD/methylene tetrahydromethanopterin reductase-like flavin-dependent oxidoreductase (luciferase family)
MERYEAGTEYIDVCFQLWENSWEDGASTWKVEPEMAYDPSKIHRTDYKGQHHQLFAYGSTHPSPRPRTY